MAVVQFGVPSNARHSLRMFCYANSAIGRSTGNPDTGGAFHTRRQHSSLNNLGFASGFEPILSDTVTSDSNIGTTEPVFRARGLTKVYGSGTAEVRALAGVDLDLFAGELIVLLGPSGSGKTTLLNQLGGLDVPTDGELRYRDIDLTNADEQQLTRFRRDSVGFIFQFYNLIPSLTARENVALVTDISDAPMNPDDALRLVNLGERQDHFPAQLSGGEQQRVAIARAIAKRPEVLLCDEPTGALDVKTGIVVLEALERANRELGTLTVIITHNAVMADMADRVIRFSDGRVQSEQRNASPAAPDTLKW